MSGTPAIHTRVRRPADVCARWRRSAGLPERPQSPQDRIEDLVGSAFKWVGLALLLCLPILPGQLVGAEFVVHAIPGFPKRVERPMDALYVERTQHVFEILRAIGPAPHATERGNLQPIRCHTVTSRPVDGLL